MIPHSPLTRLFAIGLITIGTAGCETLSEPIHSLAGASSMRVDIEVYKGPLANAPEIQWGDLVGTTVNAAEAIGRVSALYERRIQTSETCDRIQRKVVSFITASTTLTKEGNCLIGSYYSSQLQETGDALLGKNVAALHYLGRAQKTITTPAPNPDIPREQIISALVETAAIASQMQADSQWLLRELAVTMPGERSKRTAYATMANTLCQYGNQIGTRADALMKQLHGLTPERFSTGTTIRNTQPCATLDAFVWFSAFDPPLANDLLSDLFAGIGSDERRDRVRALERSFADLNWSRVNTVFAAGQGKTTMALIRDQYGNWDLKAFENDATELLEGYTKLASSALSAATELATSKATMGTLSTMQRLLKLSQQAESGRVETATDLTGTVVDGARALLLAELGEIKASQDADSVKKTRATAALKRYEDLLIQLEDAVAQNHIQVSSVATPSLPATGNGAIAPSLPAVPQTDVTTRQLPASR